jgi:hypothetical protein
MLVDEMHHAVREHEVDVDLRVLRKKRRNHRNHVQAPEHNGRRDHELAFWRGVFACHGTLGFPDLFEYAPAGGHVRGTRFGQRKLPRGA